MHRPTVGILAILMITVGGALWLTASDPTWPAALLRVGMLMAVIWLAHPHLQNAPVWLLVVAGLVVLAVLAFTGKPRVVAMVALLAFLIARLRNWLDLTGAGGNSP